MDEQRFDLLISQVGEMRGEMRAINSRMAQLETAVERIVHARTAEPMPAHYWTIITSFIIAAIIVAAMMLWAGMPR